MEATRLRVQEKGKLVWKVRQRELRDREQRVSFGNHKLEMKAAGVLALVAFLLMQKKDPAKKQGLSYPNNP